MMKTATISLLTLHSSKGILQTYKRIFLYEILKLEYPVLWTGMKSFPAEGRVICVMFKAWDSREHLMRFMTQNIIWYGRRSIGSGYFVETYESM